MALACVGPAAGGPQDDDTGAAPPVTVSAYSFYDEGTSTSAWVQIDAAGSSGGALESGQEQQVIKAAAAAAGVPDASSASGDSGVSAPSDESGNASGAVPVLTECSWRAADLPVGDPEWQGNDPATGQLMVDPCNGQQLYVFVPNEALGIAAAAAPLPPPDPAVLAQQAYAELVPPSPTAHRSPTEDMPGGAWTVVNLWTWFWVDRAGWVPLTRTVELRGVTATVTATPTVTTFDPGNGDAFVSCDGPGQAWVDPGTTQTRSRPPWVAAAISTGGFRTVCRQRHRSGTR